MLNSVVFFLRGGNWPNFLFGVLFGSLSVKKTQNYVLHGYTDKMLSHFVRSLANMGISILEFCWLLNFVFVGTFGRLSHARSSPIG